jgi:hypothetical protein
MKVWRFPVLKIILLELLSDPTIKLRKYKLGMICAKDVFEEGNCCSKDDRRR